MPELPEVETIRLGLQRYLVGHTIEHVEVRLKKIVYGDVRKIQGARVQGVRRLGKGLLIDLDNNYSIAIHIKMTGQLIYKGPRVPKETKIDQQKVGKILPNKHTHVIFTLSKHYSKQNSSVAEDVKSSRERALFSSEENQEAFLYYNDIRQFGWIKIVKTSEVLSLTFFRNLGPEILPSSGKTLTFSQFRTLLHKSKGPIKPFLMDQKKLGGVGNIYANDALFVARIHPKRRANSLSEKEEEALFEALKSVLMQGLKLGGASEWQYVNALGEIGKYQNFFQVYGRQGKQCKCCKDKIKKIVMSGRSTFFCPSCQVIPPQSI
jgi:formamidopyrimidine-DNA glycosylase